MKVETRARIAAGVIAAVLAGAPAQAAQREQKAADLTGQWTLTTAAEGPHGAVSMALTLKQDGTRVTGTLSPPHGGPIALTGEFVKNELALADPSGDGLTMKARMGADGSLSGYLSSERGDMTWTATRAKPQDGR